MTFPTYTTGTVSIGAGATTAVGTGTIWSGVNARQGDMLLVAGMLTIVSEVTDVTHLVVPPWQGATQTNVAYTLFQTSPLRFVGSDAMADVSKMISALNKSPVVVAPAASVPDPSYGNEGQYAFQPNTFKLWLMTGGVWVYQGALPGVAANGDNTLTGNNTFSGSTIFSGTLRYGGVTLSNSVTGTGSMVLSASPTFTGIATAGGFRSAGTASSFALSNSLQATLMIATSGAAAIWSGPYAILFITDVLITGATAVFILAGSAAQLIASSGGGTFVSGTSPATNQISVGYSGGNFVVINNHPGGTVGIRTQIFSML